MLGTRDITRMESSAASKTARSTYALALVTLMLGGVLALYLVQVSSLEGQLQHRIKFSDSVVLLPKTIVNIQYCQPQTVNCPNGRDFVFPGNKSLQYPGYLNVTVYYSNSSSPETLVIVMNPGSHTSGVYHFDANYQPYPQVTPESVIVPMLNGTTADVRLYNGGFGLATFILKVSYYY
jgi:hypothetical protein